MNTKTRQQVFAQLSGQDDNLGDSALRVALLEALRGEGRHVHALLAGPTMDYRASFPLVDDVTYYTQRGEWVAAQGAADRSVYVFNAGEINPRRGVFPWAAMTREATKISSNGGAVIAAGIGVKSVELASAVVFAPVFRGADVMSWRDQGSRDAVGFGDFAPDWAYAEGTPVSEWAPMETRDLIAVTMRFDRPWPGDAWLAAVRSFAAATSATVVTVAQVARDAPRAVRLAEALGGTYLYPRSMAHDDLDEHVRGVYRRSLAVVSDRAHGLIIGATEGAYPIGSGSDPQKIARLLTAAGLGGLVGRYDEFPEFAARFDAHVSGLGAAVDAARADIADLTARIRSAMDAAA